MQQSFSAWVWRNWCAHLVGVPMNAAFLDEPRPGKGDPRNPILPFFKNDLIIASDKGMFVLVAMTMLFFLAHIVLGL
jgi:hypothetical protein